MTHLLQRICNKTKKGDSGDVAPDIVVSYTNGNKTQLVETPNLGKETIIIEIFRWWHPLGNYP